MSSDAIPRKTALLLVFIALLTITPQTLHSSNPCTRLWSWFKQKITPSPEQRRTAIASASRFVSDLTFRNLHIILPGSLASFLSLEQLQNLHQQNSLTYGIIAWAASTLGQMAVIRHLESSPSDSLARRSIACLVSGTVAAVLFRVSTDYVLLLDPTAGLASSSFFIVSLIAGPIVTVKTSYVIGNAAQRFIRLGQRYLRRITTRNQISSDLEGIVIEGDEEANLNHTIVVVYED